MSKDVWPVSAWNTTERVCGTCGASSTTGRCLVCGEAEDLAKVDMFAVLDTDDEGQGEALSLFKDYGDGRMWPAGRRPVTGEQARWLRRQGDVRRSAA